MSLQLSRHGGVVARGGHLGFQLRNFLVVKFGLLNLRLEFSLFRNQLLVKTLNFILFGNQLGRDFIEFLLDLLGSCIGTVAKLGQVFNLQQEDVHFFACGRLVVDGFVELGFEA